MCSTERLPFQMRLTPPKKEEKNSKKLPKAGGSYLYPISCQ